MKKIAFIGAGSWLFTRDLVRDILTFPALRDSCFALMDINPERLDAAKNGVQRIIEAGGYTEASCYTTLDQADAIRDADIVLCTVLVGGTAAFRPDQEIPKKYGVDTNSGDTRGIGGIFRGLRTMPVVKSIAENIEKLAPNAYFLNYTNPMGILSKYVTSISNVKYMGLCHSVQGGAGKLAHALGIPAEELDYVCAGLNHQCWYIKLTHKGEDMYPKLRKAIENEDVYLGDPFNYEVMKHLGYFSAEAGGQNSEYNPWFRKSQELIDRYSIGRNSNPGKYHLEVDVYEEMEKNWKKKLEEHNAKPVNLKRGFEYASYIINALIGDGELFRFNGNTPNLGYITNLPYGCAVDIPVLASHYGFQPIKVGDLPLSVSAVTYTNAVVETLAVEGAIEGDATKIFRAVCNDPLAAAVLGFEDLKKMTEEMFEQNKDYLTWFDSLEIKA